MISSITINAHYSLSLLNCVSPEQPVLMLYVWGTLSLGNYDFLLLSAAATDFEILMNSALRSLLPS